jgi:multidrug resistance efflux pump
VEVRATGKIRAAQETTILAPMIQAQTGRITLVRFVPTGSTVKEGDVLAEFDPTEQLDQMRETVSKLEDQNNQLEQRRAENRTNTEKRASEMQDAIAELAKAEIQLRKGPVLAEVERQRAQLRADTARQRVASLKKSHAARERSDDAALRMLELKHDRQQVALERGERNVEKMVIRAPISGMVALENNYRSGSLAPPQEGDPMYTGWPLMRIFNPREMEVIVQVSEPDGALLRPGTRAEVRLDAYPDIAFTAHLVSANPIAVPGALGIPLKQFSARFAIHEIDSRILPDLAAAVIVRPGAGSPVAGSKQ